jgi:hypothetical protein
MRFMVKSKGREWRSTKAGYVFGFLLHERNEFLAGIAADARLFQPGRSVKPEPAV